MEHSACCLDRSIGPVLDELLQERDACLPAAWRYQVPGQYASCPGVPSPEMHARLIGLLLEDEGRGGAGERNRDKFKRRVVAARLRADRE